MNLVVYLLLQDTVSSMSIGKRMKDSYGDRRRVEVATSAVISSLKAWEIIVLGENRSYIQNDKVSISNPLLQILLFETVLSALDSESLYVNTITSYPLFFPFQFDLNLQELRERKDYFTFHYQGVENLVVERV